VILLYKNVNKNINTENIKLYSHVVKSDKEIKIIEEGSLILSKAHGLIASKIKPGIRTIDLDKIAYEFIKDSKAEPSFKGYKGFPSTICSSVNDEIVHGLPSNYEIKEGDIISVDSGV
jgi:methionyl aminopeptidase